MTNDLISRKALVKALIAERDKHPLEMTERYSFGAKVPCRFNQAIRGGIRKALREIEMAPAVDAAPVMHGRWIDRDEKTWCSECGESNKAYKPPFCPHCGAKMDEEAIKMLTMNEYQQLAQRTCNITDTVGDKIENGCMGLNGEAGECIDLLKKYKFQGHGLLVDKMVEELGDVLWYCAELATGLGVTLEEVAQRNIDKLRRRYPEGFDAERSINREE